jgi:hypothetical protein
MSTLRTFRGILAIVALSPILSFAADSTIFKIQSFIPERFVDTRWTVGGSLNASGGSFHLYDLPIVFTSRDQTASQRSFGTSLVSNWTYQVLTARHSWTLGLGGRFDYNGSRTNSNPPNQYDWYRTEGKSHEVRDVFSKELQPQFGFLHYFRSAAFISFTSQAWMHFTQTTNDDHSYDHTSYDTSYWGDTRKFSQSGWEERNSQRYLYLYSGELSVGIGRVDPGRYAATALYMVGELKKQHLLDREPTFAEYDSLTNIICQYRLRHAVDYRLLKIESLEAITTYLYQQRLIHENGKWVQAYLQDVWDYYPSDVRFFGKRVQLGIGISGDQDYQTYGKTFWYRDQSIVTYQSDPMNPDTTTSINSGSNNDFDNDWDVSPYIALQCEFHHPISLQLQFSLLVRGQKFFAARSQSGSRQSDLSSYYDVRWNNNLDYIVNSRTSIGLAGRVNYFTLVETPSPNDFFYGYFLPARRDVIQYYLSFYTTYRLAIPTELYIRVSLNGSRSNHEDFGPGVTSRVNYTLSASINHYLY